jgi:hypothetical protein
MDELLAHLNDTHMVPEWAHWVGGPNMGPFHGASEAWVHLETGTHVMLCWIPDGEGVPHFAQGMVMEVQVVDADNRAEPADATHRVALRDFSLIQQTLTPGAHILEAVNEGAEPHEIIIVRFHEGGDFESFMAAFSPNATGPPPADFVAGTTGIHPGDRQLVPLTVEPGRYGYICFLEEPESGAPHFALGMMVEFDVV